ncbi:MAG: type II toxin-antitoxin system RelE/ParE family toxin [Thermomicrobiales bacterium]
MSRRNRFVIVSPAAESDLADILLYTQQQWGPQIKIRYEEALIDAIADLALFPETGITCSHYFQDCRVRRVEQHLIYYKVGNDAVEVVRILHRRQDAARHLRQ